MKKKSNSFEDVYSIAVCKEDFAVAMTCRKLFSGYDAISIVVVVVVVEFFIDLVKKTKS